MRTLILLLVLTGCAAPKNSYKRFPEPKYKVRTHARDGVPSVAQTWREGEEPEGVEVLTHEEALAKTRGPEWTAPDVLIQSPSQ